MSIKWNYRYELINFQKYDDGSISYQTRSKGEIPYDEKNFRSTKLLLRTWRTARNLAEKTLKNVVVYVKGNKIISRVGTVNSPSFC